ncbi:allophanate hydrolase subunit 1 [Demequina sp. NBRC 110055]|uniref:5-oxoprolinase subunit B family protein n=1 Tax=Demequina sp. NBRC 110055 TaxID=1570344 RepID=UPI001F36282A|nr:carboxyltransferase domain-containing protein [Demequina sp. NBRC 110055]
MGHAATLIELDDADLVPALAAAIFAACEAGEIAARDVVPAATTVLVDGLSRVDTAVLADIVAAWEPDDVETHLGGLIEVPVAFDGPDLGDVAAAWAVTPDQAVAEIAATEFTVAFCGFAPGFAYLTGLPEHRAVARRAEPRTAVPAGAVGLAGPYAGVYPRSSPGGWQLVGTALGQPLWDTDRTPPALLTPGTRVRFLP